MALQGKITGPTPSNLGSREMNQDHWDLVKYWLDWIAAVLAGGALFKLVPEVGALFTIVYTGLRIYEWLKRRKEWDK